MWSCKNDWKNPMFETHSDKKHDGGSIFYLNRFLAKTVSWLAGCFQLILRRVKLTSIPSNLKKKSLRWEIDLIKSWIPHHHGNLRGPPKKYGPNKAFLRETNGSQSLNKALFLGWGVALGEHPLTFSMTPGHVALLTCFLRELGRSKPKIEEKQLGGQNTRAPWN